MSDFHSLKATTFDTRVPLLGRSRGNLGFGQMGAETRPEEQGRGEHRVMRGGQEMGRARELLSEAGRACNCLLASASMDTLRFEESFQMKCFSYK